MTPLPGHVRASWVPSAHLFFSDFRRPYKSGDAAISQSPCAPRSGREGGEGVGEGRGERERERGEYARPPTLCHRACRATALPGDPGNMTCRGRIVLLCTPATGRPGFWISFLSAWSSIEIFFKKLSMKRQAASTKPVSCLTQRQAGNVSFPRNSKATQM